MASENRSPHILNTSSNLLGFCLVVITSIKVGGFGSSTIIDESAGVASLCLMVSCLLSFLAMKTTNPARANRRESAADIAFLIGLVSLSLVVILVSFDVFR